MRTFDRERAKSFARAVKLMAANGPNPHAALAIAEKKFGEESHEVAVISKAAVGAASTTSANWAGNLSEAAGNAFFGTVAELGVHGALTAVPGRTNLTGVATGATAAFTAEGAHSPVTQLVMSGSETTPFVVTATIVMSQELAKLSDPRADELFERELRTAMVNAIDGRLLSASAATSTTPAGLFNGLTAITATATAKNDIRDLIDGFGGDLTSAIFVGSPKVMASLNDSSRPLVGIRNGEILNAPAIASRNAPAGTLAIFDAGGVAFADGDYDVSVSREAAIAMADNPSATTGHTSLFQTEAVAIRISRNVDWAAIRPGSVAYISGASW